MGKVVPLVLGLILFACATPYQRMGARGGYTEQQIAPGRWLVHVRVNGYTSQGTAYAYLLRRAGELCRWEGYDDFRLEGAIGSEDVSYVRTSYGVQRVNKPELSAVAVCTRDSERTHY